MPRLAVILPTFNRAAMLRRTLRSLESQTFRDFTVHLSDDASTDETARMSASDFPALDIRWTRRETKFSGIVEHFNTLYSETTEEWIAMAHDDEVYAPDWLETLLSLTQKPTPSGETIVMVLSNWIVVDQRLGPARYYAVNNVVSEGIYSADGLKRAIITGDMTLPCHGFLVSRAALRSTAPISVDYEQFDYEWMMRLASHGPTVVTERMLQSYTMHAHNMVGSARYLRLYFQRKNPGAMCLEWLESSNGFAPEEKERYDAQLRDSQWRGQFSSYLKTIANGDPDLCRSNLDRLLENRLMPAARKRLARILSFPPVRLLASLLVRGLLALQARIKHRSLEALTVEEAFRHIPELRP